MAFAEKTDETKVAVLSDNAFFLLAVIVLGGLTALLAALSLSFLQNVWMVGDTKIFFNIADLILKGGTPYVDLRDPKPPLIFFTLTIPLLLGEKLVGGILLVGACNLASAVLVMSMAWKLYGRLPGLLAGLLFAMNMALAEGFFILTEPFTLVFILASVYLLLFSQSGKKYLLSGVCAGIAIGFKQYALLLIPLSLFFMYRNKELKGALQFFAGLLVPLLIIFGAVFLFYGSDAGFSSLYWSFGVADSYFTQGAIGDIPAYRAESPLVGAANAFLESGLFISLLVLASASVLLDRRYSRREEFFILAGLGFLSLLVIRQYLHYWALALPFLILLCVRPYRHHALGEKSKTPIKLRYPAIAMAIFALIFAAFAAVEYVLVAGLWRPFDIQSYYGLTDPTAKMLLGMLDNPSSSPFFLWAIVPPAQLPWNLIVVGILALVSAGLVTLIGIRSYGMRAGLLAGLLFTVNIVWAQGYMSIAEALALALVLACVFLLTLKDKGITFFVSGLFAGTAACFEPFALLVVPVFLYGMLKRGERTHILALVAGALLSVTIGMSIALFGGTLPQSIDGGLTLAGISFSGSPLRSTDSMMAIANIVLAICLFASMIPMALGGYLSKKSARLDGFFMATGLIFIGTFLLKDYLHYWFMALPFMALLCAGASLREL